jgi:hypothetical protein
MCLIKLDQDNQPYYVDQFGAPAKCSETVQWKSINGRFSVTIRDAIKYFNPPVNCVEKFIVDSTIGGGLSNIYTIINNLATGTQIPYEVYCISKSDQGDAPPRIIITPSA